MTIQDIKLKYSTIYCSYKKIGLKNKIYFLILTLPAALYSYLTLEAKYLKYHNSWKIPHIYIIYIAILIEIGLILIVLSIKSISFINYNKVKSYKYYFKFELFECIKKEIPEIKSYIQNQKINRRFFDNSNLFTCNYSDYVGDDWIGGEINNFKFEMCELHVFSLLKNVFSGIFVRIKIKENSINLEDKLNKNSTYFTEFENRHNAKVLTSSDFENIYIAVKIEGDFFESDNTEMIESIDENFIILKDTVNLIKVITS